MSPQMPRLLFAVPIIVSVFGFAHAQTQMESNQQACDAYKKADAEMNKVYQRILYEYEKGLRFVAKLKAAQRAWIAFRDAHLESIYPATDKRAQYGSVKPCANVWCLKN